MRKWLKRSLWTVAVLAGVLVGGIIGIVLLVPDPFGEALGYEARCASKDYACTAWSTFRESHPFPYQAIAVKTTSPGKWVVVVSEPPPSVDKNRLDELAKKAFVGAQTASEIRRLRWRIGQDGWLEDLVVTVDLPSKDTKVAELAIREGAASLHTALFGTNYGAEIEKISERPMPPVRSAVAAFHATPKELTAWMKEPALVWQRIGSQDSEVTWPQIVSARSMGAFAARDGSLVILTFPVSAMSGAGSQRHGPEALRIPFRQFSVASEGIVGGLWTDSGQVALVARARSTSQFVAPPLRFETFAILLGAAVETEELAQSYERNQPFAGKLSDGPYFNRDWAPIYLSPQLVDTELGALLNITDQMLKSWSSAGQVEYLYFDYPKPASYPFGDESLQEIVLKKTGEQSVLFNWNTSGLAVIVRAGGQSVLTSGSSGSLPVTYGAGGKTAAEGGADMFDYEDSAYQYFSTLNDANLQRVVQYTVIYQVLRAVAKDAGLKPPATAGQAPADAPAMAVAKARMQIVNATRRFLAEFPAKRASYDRENAEILASFMEEHAALGEDQMARLLADRQSDEAQTYLKAWAAQLDVQRQPLMAREKRLQQRIDAYNSQVGGLQAARSAGRQLPVAAQKLRIEREAISAEENSLKADFEQWEASAEKSSLQQAMKALWRLVGSSEDLEPVRGAYVRAFAHEAKGSIRTPSIVVSWNSKHLLEMTGGHNLDAKALRFEVAPDVQSLEIKRAADGTVVLRYNPSQADAVEGAAPKLARAFEHRAEHDVSKLRALMAENTPARTRQEALLLDKAVVEVESPPVFAKIGERLYTGKEEFVEDLKTMAGQSDCCLVILHDAQRNAFVAEPNLKPPPTTLVYEVLDTPTMVGHLRRFSENSAPRTAKKAMIFLDQPESYVESIMKNMRVDSELSPPPMISGGGGRKGPPPGERSTFFAQDDFNGKPRWLKMLTDPVGGLKQIMLDRMARPIPPTTWAESSARRMSVNEVGEHLKILKWESVRDGMPVGVRVSVPEAPNTTAYDLSVIAGVEGNNAEKSTATLLSASDSALRDAAVQGAAPGQYLINVKARLSQLDDKQLHRLVLVMQSSETKMYFVRVDGPDGLRWVRG